MAQKTKAQLNTEVGTTFPDQTTGQITPSGVRAFQNDVINSIMPTAPVVNNNFASFDGATGLLKDSGISSSSQFVANANIIPGPANTFKGTTDGLATSDIALTACSLTYQITKWVAGTGWQCGINPVVPSRAIAATLNLSAFRAVTTQGYTTPGDGGGTTYVNKNSAVNTYTITTAGTCTNGTWAGVKFSGGTGAGFAGTVTCSGGVATAVTPIGAGSRGNGYTAGDVLTASCNQIGGCGPAPQITVATIGNAPFTDAFTSTFTTVSGGSTCTNGTYYGVAPTGGNGSRLMGVAVIAGNVLSSFTQSTPGGAYKVGDQLTLTGITGCATNPVIQVATLSSPLGSFTDSVGNALQYAPESSVSVKHFGAVADFVAGQTDGDATDNGPAMRAALQYASIGNGPADSTGGYNGTTVYVPQGAYKVCGGLVVYEYTLFRGAGWGASQIKQCNSDSAGTNFVTLGDSSSHVGNFENKVWDITLFGGFLSGSAYMIYSNNAQSGDAIARVAIYGLSRGCVKYDTGYGGQSMFGMRGWLCVINPTYFTSGGPAFDLSGNFGFVIDGQSHIAGASAGGSGVRFGDGGTNFVNGLHCEGGVTNCISINGAGSSPPMTTIIGALGPATNLIHVETGTPANFTTVINARPSGAACTVYMQATASCAKTGNQLGLATY
ncbi:glycosyl hydrolase family 28-related protein [Bradyrhizobium sp. AC87j1]|uniref:glycosyl hydrolase family 28-related protein n=1 Tax=Bradyrhizobium sp. AC87j1 TaxID=2055894 RepID=UPI001374BEDF|nr:glycosyl hydrolase family 28-related protein [Bradyrhizobium sp. AC87j1]